MEREAVEALISKRIILVAGKGGVGRSTLAAASAVAASRKGRRVLLTEIGEPDGDYSPLARIFGREHFPAEPVALAENLYGAVLHARTGHERFLGSVLPIPALVRAGMRSKALRYLLDAAPSFNEMGVFYHLLSLLRETLPNGQHRHELVILDMPATGHTLALTSLPDILLGIMPRGPIARDMREGQSYLNSVQHTHAWVVTLPENLPINECLDLIRGLEETKVPVGAVVVNRVVKDSFSKEEREVITPRLQGQGWYGALRFQRLEESDHAIARLNRETRAPLFEVPELTSRGPALQEALVQTILTGLAKRLEPDASRPALTPTTEGGARS